MKSHSQAETRRRAIQEALSKVDPIRRPVVAERAQQPPLSYRAGYIRAAAGIASPRQAIRANCLYCLGWDRNAVSECTSSHCPLWTYRFGSHGQGR